MNIPPEVFYGIGALVLLAAIGYGVLADKTRNKANDRVTEAATKAEYDQPESYDKGTEQRLEERVRD